jgi:feruloyl esterase
MTPTQTRRALLAGTCLLLAAGRAAADPAAQCAALAAQDFAHIQDAPATIQSAAPGTLALAQTPICRVDGTVLGNSGFQLALPLQGWNGKYLQQGCGGACGTTAFYWCFDAVKRGYACLSTDMGHRSGLADWSWAHDSITARADFGYRATHAASLAGRAITQAYYGTPPSHAYFMGCSTGGRQAYTLAQRYPTDFDGIVAGSAPHSESGSGLQLAWTVLANLRPDGSYIIQAPQAKLLHAAVVASCDKNDGVQDGLIGDPRQCHFDPAVLACKPGQSADACLAPDQITAARKMYAGPTDSHGHQIGHQGGVMPGSELNWIGDYMPRDGKPPQYVAFMGSFFRNIAFDPALPASWSLKDLDFDRDPQRLGTSASLFDATNPDLRAYQARGGKLLAFQGWSDTSVVPLGTIDYYESVLREMGGVSNTQAFYRLFLVPGMRHCSSNSEGADVIDYLGALDSWVEKATPPDRLIGHQVAWPKPVTSTPIFPIPPNLIRKTRPAFPFPAAPHFKGGNPDDPSNWEPK